MTNLNRVRAVFGGFPGAPGVSTFYCLDPESFLPNLRLFLQNFAGILPAGVTIDIEPLGDQIVDTTGVLVGTWTAAVPAAIIGSGSGSYAAPAGICVNWITSQIYDGHRLRGRTFMVPLVAAAYEGDGTIGATLLANLRTNAQDFVSSVTANMVVWHRPIPIGKQRCC